MIKSLTLKCFRKHEDTRIDFTTGLNVLRGPNEVGKTTVTEGFLYALYGAASLVDTLSEVVTWGQKESALKVTLVISISNIDYVFTRSKAGAECTYSDGNGGTLRVTGQKEVTAFAATLLGADAKTASVLMLASQSGLRGALDEGATAVSALMGKLADFEVVDRILQNAAATLSLGSAMPVTAKLVEAENEVVELTSSQVDPETIEVLRTSLAARTAEQVEANLATETLSEAVGRAGDARDEAAANNKAFEAAVNSVARLQARVASTNQLLAHAEQAATKRVPASKIEVAREAVAAAKSHADLLAAYKVFQTLGDYPELAWDSDKVSFDAERVTTTKARNAAAQEVDLNAAEVKALNRALISGDGVCPTCKRAADNHDHVLKHNADIQQRINAINSARPALLARVEELDSELKLLAQVSSSAERRQVIINKVSQHVSVDESVYPCKVVWTSPTPDTKAPDTQGLLKTLAELEAIDRGALQAQGMVTAHKGELEVLAADMKQAELRRDSIKCVDSEPLIAAYEAAFRAYSAQSAKAREIGYEVQEMKTNLALIEQAAKDKVEKLAAALNRVAELVDDIKTLEFNNELVRKLKSMKPMITDHLWNSVLAAVSNFFSQLRGEQSIVTKDATGFKVNSRGGSLSGSTLDMLALAIRVALSKTFVPHASFMVLDEPAHGCDNVRASSLLGFLAGAGFNQTILASHDELSESVADNVITLGA